MLDLFNYLINNSLAYLTLSCDYPDSDVQVEENHAKRLRFMLDKIWYSRLQGAATVIETTKGQLGDVLEQTLAQNDYNIVVSNRSLADAVEDCGIEPHISDPDPDYRVLHDMELILMGDDSGKMEFDYNNFTHAVVAIKDDDPKRDEYRCKMSVRNCHVIRVIG